MPDAVIASEDIRFLSHPGFDLVAIQESLANAKSDERMRGGSTITQQLAKNLFLDGRRTLLRKLRELILALSLEDRMSKDAILTLYLNVVEFGPGIWGIRDAADAWFLKTPDRLTPREAAFLASILPAPRMWHEKISTTGKVPISRVNEVLARMRRRGSLSQTQYDQARAEKLRVVPPQPKG
jgi:membrane peptidoglycan carboxypeptidase